MWIEDLTKALWELNAKDIAWTTCVEKIQDNIIYLSNGTTYTVQELVQEYNDEYGA